MSVKFFCAVMSFMSRARSTKLGTYPDVRQPAGSGTLTVDHDRRPTGMFCFGFCSNFYFDYRQKDLELNIK